MYTIYRLLFSILIVSNLSYVAFQPIVFISLILFSLYFFTDDPLLYNRNYSHTVLFHEKGSNFLLVGGLNFVLQVDFENGENEVKEILKHYQLKPLNPYAI